MHCLNRTISLIEQGKAGRETNRKQAIASLEVVIAKCEEASKIWQEYLKSPGAPGDKWSVLSWVGAERAKRLHEIGLEAGVHMVQACASLDAQGRHSAALDDSVIVQGYSQLKPGETGTDAAKSAVQQMQERSKQLGKYIERIKSAPAAPAKNPGQTAAPKAVKKAAKKKAVKKAASKKAAPKKAAPKKAVKKKSVPKKAAKKPPAKKAKKKTKKK
jgi:hypothetical protein